MDEATLDTSLMKSFFHQSQILLELYISRNNIKRGPLSCSTNAFTFLFVIPCQQFLLHHQKYMKGYTPPHRHLYLCPRSSQLGV